MNLRCKSKHFGTYLGHLWGKNSFCVRCGATGCRGNYSVETWEDVRSPFVKRVQALLAGLADQHGSRHHQHSQADDSSSAVFVGSLACSEAL